MSIIMIRDRPDKATKYMNLASEDLLTALLWSRIRMIHPNILLRAIVNESLGREAISDGELGYTEVAYSFWRKLPAPSERSPRNRPDGLTKALFGATIGPKEGLTEADVFVELGNKLTGQRLNSLLLVEAKLRANPSRSTTWDEDRGQNERNIDVTWHQAETQDARRFFYILMDLKYQPDTAIVQLKNPEKIASSFPYRDQKRFPPNQVAESIGWISYSRVREILAAIRPQLATTAEVIACDDALVLLEDVIIRHGPRRTLFDSVPDAEDGDDGDV